MKLTIRNKIVFVQAVSILSILFLLMIFNSRVIQKEFLNSEIRKAEIIAETISGLISASLEIELIESAIEVLENTHNNNPNIIKTEILNLNGEKIIVVENRKTNNTSESIIINKKILNSVETSEIAIMKIHYSTYEYEELQERHNTIFLLLLSLVAIFILLSIYIANKLLSPFYNLADKLMNFKPEESNTIITQTNREDEVGIIQNAIYTVVKKLNRQQDLLIQQSKLAAMGEMIGNIAHQWRQPLAHISGVFMNIEGENEFGELTDEYLNKKLKEGTKVVNYMSKTIEDFRNFFKSDKNIEKFKFKDSCQSAISLVKPSLKFNNISFEFEISNDDVIIGHPHEYSQVILNIISNAKDILLERKIKNPKIIIKLFRKNNKSIVSILDNAGGVKINPIEKIFEPYFTTKHSSQGTGIGLYMSKMIIEKNMKGKLIVKNQKDGAEFQIII